eukprot:scaffold8873_cov100-Skeletonema_dohrnii-CCMP3373.AAC.2
MKFSAIAFATVVASSASTASAFTVSPGVVNLSPASTQRTVAFPTTSTQPRSSRAFISSRNVASSSSPTSLNLAGGGGTEALQDYITSLSTTASPLVTKMKNPKLIKLAGVAAVPLSYALGAAMTPSRRLAARAVGGVVAAVTAGGVGKNAVEEDVRRSCPSAIAARLVELGVDGDFVSDGIDRLKEDYGVEEEDFTTMKTEVYSVYLVGMAKNPLAKTAELKELSNLREALSLDNMQ